MARAFPCIDSCGESFTSGRQLKTHQNRCSRAIEDNVQRRAAIAAAPRQDTSNRLATPLYLPPSKRRRLLPEGPNAKDLLKATLFEPNGALSSAATTRTPRAPSPPPASLPNEFPNSAEFDAANQGTDILSPNPSIPCPSQPMPQPQRVTRSAGRPSHRHPVPQAPPKAMPEPPPPPPPPPEALAGRPLLGRLAGRVRTWANSFGVWRDYPSRPSYDPDGFVTVEDLTNRPPLPVDVQPAATKDSQPSFWPFKNQSIRDFMAWQYNGATNKSLEDSSNLVRNVILAPGFDPSHFEGFDIRKESERVDKEIHDSSNLAGFTAADVTISVPSGSSDLPPQGITIPGLHYRNLTTMIKEAFQDPIAANYHLSPFTLHSGSKPGVIPPVSDEPNQERLYGEIYTSDAFLAEYYEVKHNSPPPLDNPGCQLEKVVAALMFASDSTCLAQFGDAKAWPIYLMLGNLSKYIRAQVTAGAVHHLAYIPSLSEAAQNEIASFHSKWKTQSSQILTHCRRELMHAVWSKILDDEFIHACKYGIVIKCIDGVERRVYPRIFTYSADYPEKALLATIRDKGLHPCPRCYVSKEHLDRLGTPRDRSIRTRIREVMVVTVRRVRDFIYRLTRPVGITSKVAESNLKPFSGVPTINAFTERLGDKVLPSKMLVVDLLHEFEIGTWKMTFTHLIRLLYAAGEGSDHLIRELNDRYSKIQPFGRSTIRRFPAQVSEMKQLAARDWEDMLQCAIPAFEGLLPEPHNKRLMKLLYRSSEWHALAKLRMHSDTSLRIMDKVTTEFGDVMRQFRDLTCSQYSTVETPREVAARARRAAKAAEKQGGGVSKSKKAPNPANPPPSEVAVPAKDASAGRTFNISTIKFHFLGDYVNTIRQYGTTDSYSTQLGELAHRTVKSRYRATNKKNAMAQIGKQVLRQKYLNGARLAEKLARRREALEADRAVGAGLLSNYFISKSKNRPLDLYNDLAFKASSDPACKDFIPKLKDHILGRIHGLTFDGDGYSKFTEEERNNIHILKNKVYEVATARFYYTTYDVRRDYDTISPSRSPFVMVHSQPDENNPAETHPFWYASVVGIFHADIQQTGRGSKCLKPKPMNFLWVRWLGVDPSHKASRAGAKLPKVGFVPEVDEYAFGFLDPNLVIRGAHLIPCFEEGRSDALLRPGNSRGRMQSDTEPKETDWLTYYVGIFADRDIFMRHFGGGVGHRPAPSEGTPAERRCEMVATPDPIPTPQDHPPVGLDAAFVPEPVFGGELAADGEEDADESTSECGGEGGDDDAESDGFASASDGERHGADSDSDDEMYAEF